MPATRAPLVSKYVSVICIAMFANVDAMRRQVNSVDQDNFAQGNAARSAGFDPLKDEMEARYHKDKVGNMVRLLDDLKSQVWCKDKIGQMVKIVKAKKLGYQGYVYVLEGCRGQYTPEQIEEFTEAPTAQPTPTPTPAPTRGCEDDPEFTDEKGTTCADWEYASQSCDQAVEAYSYSEEGQADLLAHCPLICGTCEAVATPAPTHHWRLEYAEFQKEGHFVTLLDSTKARAWCRDKIGTNVKIIKVMKAAGIGGFGAARFNKGYVYELEGCRGRFKTGEVTELVPDE